jgi:hypothetical protein
MKPIAYITPNGILYKELPPDAILELTPLYKELKNLTDAQILEVAKNIEPLNGSTMEQAFIYFARAILKEANKHD